jgi:hypothetical protein
VAAGAAKAGRASAKVERINEVFILIVAVGCSDESIVMIEMMRRSSKTLIYSSTTCSSILTTRMSPTCAPTITEIYIVYEGCSKIRKRD